MKLPLTFYGNPILRKKCLPIEEITDEIRKLARDMIDTMDANNGIGLAAPQVGHAIRLFVLRNYVRLPDGKIGFSDPKYYINPKLSNVSDQIVLGEEGCVSIPGLHEDVPRPISVTVEALDLDGKPFTEHLRGIDARVVLHEHDHINGVLFIDRLDAETKRRIDPILRALKKAKKQ